MQTTTLEVQRPAGFLSTLNTTWHKRALTAFAFVSVAHWAEHLVQAAQVWLLDRPRTAARGVLGAVFPWLVHSEWLHYGYAVVMLLGLVALLPAFTGRARTWWTAALIVQMWHHAEHALLLYQAQTHQNLFGEPVPTSIVQLVFPRVELHLIYNAIVTIPMVAAIYLHLYPSKEEAASTRCTCVPGGPAALSDQPG